MRSERSRDQIKKRCFPIVSQRPQTADEALQCIAGILANLPDEELAQLTCIFELDGCGQRLFLAPDFGLLDLIMDLTEQERRTLLIEVVQAVPPKERRRWIRYYESGRPEMMGYVMVGNGLLAIVLDALKGSINWNARDADRIRELGKKLERHGNGPRALGGKTKDRNVLLDELLAAERTQGVPMGQEDWQKVHAAIKRDRGDLIAGQNGQEMDAEGIKKQAVIVDLAVSTRLW